MTVDETHPTVARFWTGARRFPRLIGKTVNGDRIPGGPYTVTQAIGGTLTLWLLWESRPLWGTGQLIADLFFIVAAGYGVLWGLGKVPIQTRNPIILAAGLVQALIAPREGRLAGSPRALRNRSHRAPLFNPPAPIYNDVHAAAMASVAQAPKPSTEPVSAPVVSAAAADPSTVTRQPRARHAATAGHPAVPMSFAEEMKAKAEAWNAEQRHTTRERTPVG